MEYTALYYYGYRFYDPELGRWVNRDPLGARGGVNVFSLVDNNALSSVDVLGLAPPKLKWPVKFVVKGLNGAKSRTTGLPSGSVDGDYGYHIRNVYQRNGFETQWPDNTAYDNRAVIVVDVKFVASGTVFEKQNGEWVKRTVSESLSWSEFLGLDASESDKDNQIVGMNGDHVICNAKVTETLTYGALDIAHLSSGQRAILIRVPFGFTSKPVSIGTNFLLSKTPMGWGSKPNVFGAAMSGETRSVTIEYEYQKKTLGTSKSKCPCEGGKLPKDEIVGFENG